VEGEILRRILLLEKEMLRFVERRNQQSDARKEVLGFPWSQGFITELRQSILESLRRALLESAAAASHSDGSANDSQDYLHPAGNSR